MTIRKRLFISNLLMILVPVCIAALIAAGCVGAVWYTVRFGGGLGFDDSEDFYWPSSPCRIRMSRKRWTALRLCSTAKLFRSKSSRMDSRIMLTAPPPLRTTRSLKRPRCSGMTRAFRTARAACMRTVYRSAARITAS